MNKDDYISIAYAECALDILESDLPDDLKQLLFNQMQYELSQIQLSQTTSNKDEEKIKERKSSIRIPKKGELIENNSVRKAVELGYQVTEFNKEQLVRFVRMQGTGLVDSPQLEHAIHLFFS